MVSEAPSQWLSVGEAAAACAVSERTLWRWCRDGVVESRQEKRGQQNTRLVNPESLPEAVSEGVRANDSGCRDMAEVGVGCQGFNSPRHTLSEGTAGGETRQPHDEVDEFRSRLTDQAEEIRFLRDQLQQERGAGQELRVMLARLERTNSELAGALVQKALPPASSVSEDRRKVRWWWPFGRS